MQPQSDRVAYSRDWSNIKEMEALREICVRRSSMDAIDVYESLVTGSHGNTSKLGLLMVVP